VTRMLLQILAVFVISGCGGGSSGVTSPTSKSSTLLTAETGNTSNLSAAAAQLQLTTKSTTPATAEITIDQLFDWAERTYPSLFPTHQTTQFSSPYFYRYYPETDLHVGIANEGVYLLGTIYTEGKIVHVGKIADYAEAVLASITPPIPLKVYPTSYENKNSISTDETQLPSVRILKDFYKWEFTPEELIAPVVNDRSLAFGDFFQDGTYSALISVWRRTGIHDKYLKTPPIVDSPNKIHFLQHKNGRWIDGTNKLLQNPDDRYSCVSHSYTAVADFNNDKKPDLLLSCHGIDYSFESNDTISGLSYREIFPNTWRDILFEEQILLLSQPDGKYKKTKLPGKIYGHHASAGDINNDGKVDIATVNVSFENEDPSTDLKPYFLMGNGDGSFTKNYSRLPANIMPEVMGDPETFQTNIYWMYLIPVDGRLDLIAIGGRIAWYKNPGNGNFSKVSPIYIPLPSEPWFTPLDIIYMNGSFYINHSGGNWPGIMSIKKVDSKTLKVSEIYRNGSISPSYEGAISPQMKPTADKKYLVPFVAGCERENGASNFYESKCSVRILLN
jgi:hypothetical protein